MAKTDVLKATQAYLLDKHNDLLWVILRLGGQIHQQQLCRLLDGKPSSRHTTALVSKLQNAQLIKCKVIARNKVLVLCKPVFAHFGVTATHRLTAQKLLRGSLIMENYLNLNSTLCPSELRRQMERTTALYYTPRGSAATMFLESIQEYLKHKYPLWDTTGIANELEQLQQPASTQPTLYNLECVGIFLNRAVMLRHAILRVYVDYYLTANTDEKQTAKRIVAAERTVQGIFADYPTQRYEVEVCINVHSHNPPTSRVSDRVYTHLAAYPEFADRDKTQRRVSFYYYSTKATLFCNMGASSIR